MIGRDSRRSVISTDGVDGIHFTAKNNADLGRALAEKVAMISQQPNGRNS